MGEILGLGMTHYPPLTGLDQNMAGILRRVLQDPGLPERYRDPASWPAPMRARVRRTTAAPRARPGIATRCSTTSGKARRILDDFRPEVVIIWGDDQHENFTEDVIPPFCVLAYDQIEARPWQRAGGAAQRLGRAVGDDLPDHRSPGGRQAPRGRPARAGRRHGLRLQAAALPGPRPRLPQHDHVPRLRSGGLPVSGHRVPGQLLRPPGDRPARRAWKPRPPARRRETSTRRRPRRSAAWRWARRPRGSCATAPGAPP